RTDPPGKARRCRSRSRADTTGGSDHAHDLVFVKAAALLPISTAPRRLRGPESRSDALLSKTGDDHHIFPVKLVYLSESGLFQAFGIRAGAAAPGGSPAGSRQDQVQG